MYLFAILSSLICIQLISTMSSDQSNDSPSYQSIGLNHLPKTHNDIESDEEAIDVPRSTSFLRFGRQNPASSASFLRFGRSNPSFLRFGRASQTGTAFLRFGREAQQSASSNFLRFGREAQQPASGNFLRFGRKGEFLRFG